MRLRGFVLVKLVVVAAVVSGCSSGGGGVGPGQTPGRAVTAVTGADGAVAVGEGARRGQLIVLDAQTHRPVAGARIDAVPAGGGFLVQVTNAGDAAVPALTWIGHGGGQTIALEPRTADVPVRMMRGAVPVESADFIAEADFDGVAMIARAENRSLVTFLPALVEPVPAEKRFKVYRTALPATLLAIDTGSAPANAGGTTMIGRARVAAIDTSSQAAVPARGRTLAAAAAARRGEVAVAPAITDLRVAPEVPGDPQRMVEWQVEDTDHRLLGFDVGVDTTAPERRLPESARSVALQVTRGSHFVCLRPVFDGSAVEPQLRCTPFEAPSAPVAAQLRMRVTPVAPPPAGQRPFAVDIEVENTGDAEAPAVAIAVTVSRDGTVEGGLGEARLLMFDAIPAHGKATRRTEVRPTQDGQLYVAARPRTLAGAPVAARAPVVVAPTPGNRPPLVALVAGTGPAGSVRKGELFTLKALSEDPEDGDLTERILWRSSQTGDLGYGPELRTTGLALGVHRISCTVADNGAAGAVAQRGTTETWVEVLDPQAPVNSAPRLSAGPDVTTAVGSPVSPLATSWDPDGDTLRLRWTVAAAPEGSRAVLDGDVTLAPRLVADLPGVYRLSVVASDDKVEARDEVLVTALAASANARPTVMVTAPDTVAVGTAVTPVVKTGDLDGDALTVSYDLSRPDGSATRLENVASGAPTFKPDRPGIYLFTVVANDGRGGLASDGALVTAR